MRCTTSRLFAAALCGCAMARSPRLARRGTWCAAYEQFLLRKGGAVSATTEATPSARAPQWRRAAGSRRGWATSGRTRLVQQRVRERLGRWTSLGTRRTGTCDFTSGSASTAWMASKWRPSPRIRTVSSRGAASTSIRCGSRSPSLPLLKGDFTLYVFLLDESGLHIFDQRVLPSAVTIVNPAYRFGLVEIAHRWLRTSPPAARPAAPVAALAAAVRSDGD